MVISNYKLREYEPGPDSMRILNPKQAAFYWGNGVEPLDIYPSKHYMTGEPCIVYIFSREGSKDVYDRWCKNKDKDPRDL